MNRVQRAGLLGAALALSTVGIAGIAHASDSHDDGNDDHDSCPSAVQDPDCGLPEQHPRYQHTPQDDP
jgi:hypothetical protein